MAEEEQPMRPGDAPTSRAITAVPTKETVTSGNLTVCENGTVVVRSYLPNLKNTDVPQLW